MSNDPKKQPLNEQPYQVLLGIEKDLLFSCKKLSYLIASHTFFFQ